MKYLYLILTLLALHCKKPALDTAYILETSPSGIYPNSIRINNAIGGFYSSLPNHYDQTVANYPLLVFLHGGGQTGNGSSDLHLVLNEGVPELLKEGRFPPHFKINGKFYSFIVLAPQYENYPSNSEILSFITYAKQHYRVDTTRIYLSGLSSGGIITSDVGAEDPSLFAAIVPMSGISIWPDLDEKARHLANGNLPIWAFHNKDDLAINIEAVTYFIFRINSLHPKIPAKFTEFLPFGLVNHDAWTRATDPTYRENGMNIYEWMLQYHR